MNELNDQPWAEFADRLAQELIEHGATEAVIVTRNIDEDRITTNYFNCNFEKRCILLGYLLEDVVLEIIENNADTVQEMLEEKEENDNV